MTVSDSTWKLLNDPRDPRHGTLNGYINHGCRCDRCKAANTEYQAGVREAKRNAPTPRHVHGTDSGYRDYGCRLKCCREAHAAANKKHRDSRKQREATAAK